MNRSMNRLAPLLLLAASGCGTTPTPTDATDGGSDAQATLDAGPPDLAQAGPRRLILLHTNDEHSHLFAFAPELDDFPTANTPGTGTLKGGVARRMTVLKQERDAAKTAGAATLTLSAGDNVMGTLPQVGFTTTAPDFTLMKTLGYDATCLGNHEFDFGPAALATALKAAQSGSGLIPTLSTNIHFDAMDARDDTLAAAYAELPDPSKLVQKYHVLTTSNGLKVGLLGIVGANAAYVETPKAPVTFSLGASKKETATDEVLKALYADIQPTVDRLRTVEKVDLVIALSHSGVDLVKPEQGEDYRIAQNVPGIDVIVSGHTHTVVTAPIVVVNTSTKKKVFVVQAGSYGAYVGRLDLTVATDGSVSFDAAGSKLVPVDDKILPDPAMVMAQSAAVRELETKPFGMTGKSFLEGALGRIEGTPVKDDAAKEGDLYFRTLGKAPFDVVGLLPSQETELLNLASDALFAAADKYASPMGSGETTDLAIHSAGVIRGDLPKGKTGNLAFADLFRILPLGISPADGSIGYPLVHVYLLFVEIKIAFEIAANYGLQEGTNSLFLVPSGMRVTYDTTRAPFDSAKGNFVPTNGRVTKIEWISDHSKGYEGAFDTVLFDMNRALPWTPPNTVRDAMTLYGVSTNMYIASFADSVGVTLKNKNGKFVPLPDTIVHRKDAEKSEVKDFEALAEYIRGESMKNGGNLPSRYNAATPEGKVPRRMLCSGPVCPK
ncbi:MAG: hypothetical protein EXR72_00930 [Myxococcales bacterium]|nr:hypothetical protein [Myxococcales bacterium]